MGPSHPEKPWVVDCTSDNRALDEFNAETCAEPVAPVVAPANTSLLMFPRESGEVASLPEAVGDRRSPRTPAPTDELRLLSVTEQDEPSEPAAPEEDTAAPLPATPRRAARTAAKLATVVALAALSSGGMSAGPAGQPAGRVKTELVELTRTAEVLPSPEVYPLPAAPAIVAMPGLAVPI